MFMDGFILYQRSGSRKIKEFQLLGSNDGNNWQDIHSASLLNGTGGQVIIFNETFQFRYFRLVAKSSHDGERFAALAEFSPFLK